MTSVKGQRVNFFGFAGLMVFVTATQLYRFRAKAATDNVQMNEPGFVPLKHYLQEQQLLMDDPWVASTPSATCSKGLKSHLILPTLYEANIIIMLPMLQIKKLRLREEGK